MILVVFWLFVPCSVLSQKKKRCENEPKMSEKSKNCGRQGRRWEKFISGAVLPVSAFFVKFRVYGRKRGSVISQVGCLKSFGPGWQGIFG